MDISKLPIERISEVDRGVTTVHYQNCAGRSVPYVTLCDVADWMGHEEVPETTTAAVTCGHCLALAAIFTSAVLRAQEAKQGEQA